ncbi:hypothetical protein L596_009100 [Steinernema carpocapsae]|uniref:Uncharacterized protein n=1 Tax=Steinernema carpocapsae TaxID=34508 RepID=A0A4U5PES3_STECR|nr:hypothetical protein L596_009100 [Steinernema carpocapsae]
MTSSVGVCLVGPKEPEYQRPSQNRGILPLGPIGGIGEVFLYGFRPQTNFDFVAKRGNWPRCFEESSVSVL